MANNTPVSEQQIKEDIEAYIKNFTSFCFNAGAGAGKTYTLVESIRYLLKNHLEELQKNNQKIICITYTNVAQQEISERLGNSNTVIVSTIHEQLWKIIKKYQNELLIIHKKHIENELTALTEELSDKTGNLSIYAQLDSQQQNAFVDFMMDDEIRKQYFQATHLKAQPFREFIQNLDEIPSFISDMLSNVSNFKSVVSKSILQRKYQVCLEKITSGENTSVKYDSHSNIDKLHQMKFSHDTLLDYAHQLINSYPKLQRIIVDKYPYIFVDEYQDTAEKVVKILVCLHRYATAHQKNWLVGYFGDTAQNIYDDGVGDRLSEIHQNLGAINKLHNRRSEKQIIDAINKIRNDEIQQTPLDTSRSNGSVALYYKQNGVGEDNRTNVVQQFLEDYTKDLTLENQDTSNIIDCLVLTNKTVSEYSGFGELYNSISSAGVINFRDINTKLLSNDLDKLDESMLHIYRLLDLRYLITLDNISYQTIFGDNLSNISFNQAKKFIHQLREVIATENLGKLTTNVSNLWENESENMVLERCFSNILNLSVTDLNDAGYQQFIHSQLQNVVIGRATTDDEFDIGLERVETLLNLNIEQWQSWYQYIKREQIGSIRYHTYHGTKGSEFDNVAVIMEHTFGRDRNKFKNYFTHLAESNTTAIQQATDENMISTRNLVYVACSRAKRHLRVLYLDDISEFREVMEDLFTQTHILENSS